MSTVETVKYPPLGSVSEGTLRTQDLLENLLDVLEEYAPEVYKGIRVDPENKAVFDYLEDPEHREEPDAAQDLLGELHDRLDEIAAPYTYFGAHEGDGADFGYWVSFDSLEEDARARDGVIKINAGDEWPDPMDPSINYVMEVTDHGNVTLYGAHDHAEVWSCV